MKTTFKVPLMAMLAILSSCSNDGKKSTEDNTLSASNPFLSESKLPYQAVAFDKINDSDFKPALEEGMKQHLGEIEKIANNTAAPSFENTLVAMEKSGAVLTRVNRVFGLITGANTNDQLQKLQEEVAPKLAAHQDAIYLNSKLFKRIETIYNQRTQLNLDAESNRLIEYYYQNFELAGAKLTDEQKTALKKLNEQEASLSAKFSNQLLAASKAGALVVADKAELAGLSEAEMDAAAQTGKTNQLEGKWIIQLQNTTQQPDLLLLSNRNTRKNLFEASWNRAEQNNDNDTRKTIVQIAKIRAEKAKLMGFPNYATWKLQDQMAKTPAAVDAFFDKLVPSATAKARAEAADIQAVIDKEKGGFKLEAYDWNHYAEKVRKAKYDLDENQVKPYFELNNVLQNGVFYAATQLYGITFKERTDLPVYHKDVKVYELFNEDKSSIGLFYCDYFKRDNKSGGAWMDNMVGQSTLLGTKPVIFNVCNFSKPVDGQPALISFDDVTTMFHEFGHALHGFFANQKYPGLSGTNVARDFVEFPSQFNEHWALDPAIFRKYATHYKTGEPMPQALVDKIKKASTFNQGYALTEVLAAAALDMQWHKLSAAEPLQDANKFETAALQKTHLDLPYVPSRYRSSYFLHIWGNGYAAGYYAYLWTEMLDHDAFEWFGENGGLTRANGQRFRDMILSKGNTEDYGKMFRNFRGHDPSITAMQKSRGLPTK
ncbi:peptidyl-dipeptidase Dcp [Pedobacter frigoris]|uniref:Dipeptidyl carboxypeptidase n=1 Tax=Pedobacter frigoris TaxID=2571272 RepID=A0A4U1CLL6_9SPHI|nr:peptidyl-dipeptidase Dcp [Pedobacter frigoris]TKC08707.1 peptidyl-dipeptidase Dcp [Pedobacter frigoris]